ncbi:hypothetical protein HZA73_00115 [candidate division TA06 bacterium]|nr:hypothetical protein [candidate division TA06 bacterium]
MHYNILKILIAGIFLVTVSYAEQRKQAASYTPTQVASAMEAIAAKRGYTIAANIQRSSDGRYDILIKYINFDTSFKPTLGNNSVMDEFVKLCVSQTGALKPPLVDWNLGHLYMLFGDSIFGIDSKVCKQVINFSHKKEEKKAVSLYKRHIKSNTPELRAIINQFTIR